MAVASTASAEKKIDKNALALKKINDRWKGNSVEVTNAAAFDIGRLVAACMLSYSKAKDTWSRTRYRGNRDCHAVRRWPMVDPWVTPTRSVNPMNDARSSRP
jgi:hypothetical protein